MSEPDLVEERCPRCYRVLQQGACPGCEWREPLATAAQPADEPSAAPAWEEPPPPPASSAAPPAPTPAGLPPTPTGGYTAPPAGPQAMSLTEAGRLPRVIIWPLIIAVCLVYFALAGGAPVGPERLLLAGGLTQAALADPAVHWWRLVLATFLHSNGFILLISGFMLWILGGQAERSAGGGLVLTLAVVGGALLNLLRAWLEPAASLLAFAGAWPVGLALGGAAISLGRRLPERTGRGVLASLVFEAGLLLIVAYSLDLFGWGLAAVCGAAVLMGLGVGALWPLGPQRGAAGCFMGLAAGIVVFSAFQAQRAAAAAATPPPPEWRRENPEAWRAWQERHGSLTEADVPLAPREVPELELALDLPQSWGRVTLSRSRDCPGCGQEVELPPDAPDAPKTVPCPACGAEVPARQPTRQALFREGGFLGGRRQVLVWAAPRGPFDAPDTLAARSLAELGRPDSWFREPAVLDERPFESPHLGAGYVVWIRGELQGSAMRMRIYVFVSGERTVLIRAMTPDADGPEEQAAISLFDRIAASVRLVGGKK